MAPNYLCKIKIQMPTAYISLERKFYQDYYCIKTKVQKLPYFELLIKNRRNMFLKVAAFFVKNCQGMKK